MVRSQYIDHVISEVERIELVDSGFRVTTSELRSYSAKTVIITTGMTRRKLGVAGEKNSEKRRLLGNIQDLSFAQDRTLP